MTVDELRKAKAALDDDLSRMIHDRLLDFQESASGLIPSGVVVTLHLLESDRRRVMMRCEVSTNLTLW